MYDIFTKYSILTGTKSSICRINQRITSKLCWRWSEELLIPIGKTNGRLYLSCAIVLNIFRVIYLYLRKEELTDISSGDSRSIFPNRSFNLSTSSLGNTWQVQDEPSLKFSLSVILSVVSRDPLSLWSSEEISP